MQRQAVPPVAGSHSTHREIALPRRIETVIFSGYEIHTAFPSPYPLEDHAPAVVPIAANTLVSDDTRPAKRRRSTVGAPAPVVGPPAVVDVAPDEVRNQVDEQPEDVTMDQEEPEIVPESSPHRSIIIPDSEPDPSPVDTASTSQADHTGEGTVPHEVAKSPSSALVRARSGRFANKPNKASPKSMPEAVPRGLTQREQRELARKAREERGELSASEKREREKEKPPVKRLFVCEGCFKYTLQEAAMTVHKKSCALKKPPGTKVYQRGAHIIWEIDGAKEKLYCQNLSLFSKLFIEHKYVFYDIEGFKFYVLTDATPSFDYVLAYFSKEKVSYDDNNLACIVTFPPYQKKGYGTLLIEFSYELSRRTSETPGSPERPLSALGERGYLAYWTGVLVRYFRATFEARGEPHPLSILGASNVPEVDEEARKKRTRRSRGWEGELPPEPSKTVSSYTTRRHSLENNSVVLTGTSNGTFSYPSSLSEIAERTNLRLDDVAFTLVESGLAQWRRPAKRRNTGKRTDAEEEEDETKENKLEILITPELVEEVATVRKVRDKTMMELAHVLL